MRKEKLEEINNMPEWQRKRKLEEYEWQKIWYSHVVDKQDFIHKAKTEGLFKVFYRVASQFGLIEYTSNSNDNLIFNIVEQLQLKKK